MQSAGTRETRWRAPKCSCLTAHGWLSSPCCRCLGASHPPQQLCVWVSERVEGEIFGKLGVEPLWSVMDQQRWATFCCCNPRAKTFQSKEKPLTSLLTPLHSCTVTGMSKEFFSYDANVLQDWASTWQCKKQLQREDKENINLPTEFESDFLSPHQWSILQTPARSCSPSQRSVCSALLWFSAVQTCRGGERTTITSLPPLPNATLTVYDN